MHNSNEYTVDRVYIELRAPSKITLKDPCLMIGIINVDIRCQRRNVHVDQWIMRPRMVNCITSRTIGSKPVICKCIKIPRVSDVHLISLSDLICLNRRMMSNINRRDNSTATFNASENTGIMLDNHNPLLVLLYRISNRNRFQRVAVRTTKMFLVFER